MMYCPEVLDWLQREALMTNESRKEVPWFPAGAVAHIDRIAFLFAYMGASLEIQLTYKKITELIASDREMLNKQLIWEMTDRAGNDFNEMMVAP